MFLRVPPVCTAVMCCVLTMMPGPARAQQPEALTGVVLDPVQAPIAGALVIAMAPPAPPATTRTGADGHFSLRLDPGTYDVTVAMDGFATATQRLSLAAGR